MNTLSKVMTGSDSGHYVTKAETKTVSIRHDDLLTGVKTKVFELSESDKNLWYDLPNVVKVIGMRHQKCSYQVRVVIPDGHKVYSVPVVIDNRLVFTYPSA